MPPSLVSDEALFDDLFDETGVKRHPISAGGLGADNAINLLVSEVICEHREQLALRRRHDLVIVTIGQVFARSQEETRAHDGGGPQACAMF